MDAIMLAAGNSRRFGENKLLCMLDKKPLYRYMLELLYRKLRERRLGRLVVVSQYEEILADVAKNFPGVEAVRNPEPKTGISGSIRRGLDCLSGAGEQAQSCLFAVADQPGFTAQSFERMLDFWETHSYGIVAAARSVPGHPLQMKNPVIFSSRYYGELRALTGDTGGKQVIRRHMEDTGGCEIPAAELEDLDTRDALLCFGQRLVFAREFPFLREPGHIVSIVGAGGKTTLMNALAFYCADTGRRVVVTTTTHIMRPEAYPTAKNREQLKEFLKRGGIAAAGADAPEGKLCASDRMALSDYRQAADLVLVEADGAKHFPCKVPREREPVILEASDIVIGVMGMDALDQPLSGICFGREKAMELLGVGAEHRMREEDLAKILLSEKGTRKGVGQRDYYIVLNKCDDRRTEERAGAVRELLLQNGAEHVVCMSCRQALALRTAK